MLRIERLAVAYGDFQVLWDVSLEVRAGEIVALLGPNGAGKSTLLGSVSGLVPPRHGRIELDGRPIERLGAHQRVPLGERLGGPISRLAKSGIRIGVVGRFCSGRFIWG